MSEKNSTEFINKTDSADEEHEIININVTNDDLKINQYSDEVLICNIKKLFILTILETQKGLSHDFIENYVLNDDYHKNRKDKDLTIFDIIKHQPQYAIKSKKCKYKN